MADHHGVQTIQLIGHSAELIGHDHPALHKYIDSVPDHWAEALTNQRHLDQTIEDIWSPIIHRARGFTFRMVNMTIDLRLVVSPSETFQPQLFYLTEQSEPMHGWIGGRPAQEIEILRQEEKLGRSLPDAYKTFVHIHNGLLAGGSMDTGIMPLNHLRLISAEPDSLIQTESSIPIPENLLVFCKHQSGNFQCFDLISSIGSGDFLTVQIDQNTRVVGEPESFWGFLKRFAIEFLK